MKNLFKELYESEINLQFGWFWDAGFDVKIGNEMSGYIAEFNSYDLNECEKWIEEKVKELYPNSKFAKTYKGDTFESATEPAIRFLFKNWHPHTKIYIDYSSAELLTGEQCHNLNNEIPD
jgi:hypothetical protein